MPAGISWSATGAFAIFPIPNTANGTATCTGMAPCRSLPKAIFTKAHFTCRECSGIAASSCSLPVDGFPFRLAKFAIRCPEPGDQRHLPANQPPRLRHDEISNRLRLRCRGQSDEPHGSKGCKALQTVLKRGINMT